MEVLVSDDHAGLVKAAPRSLQGGLWPRCQVHLGRNVFGRTPRPLRAQMAAGLRRSLQAADRPAARAAFAAVAAALEGRAARAWTVLEEGREDALAVVSLPEKDRVRLRTPHGMERLNEEMRWRERGLRLLPNEAAALRRIGALLAEQHEVWSTVKRYVDMAESDAGKGMHTQEVQQELSKAS